jgi:hypothetical protein
LETELKAFKKKGAKKEILKDNKKDPKTVKKEKKTKTIKPDPEEEKNLRRLERMIL